MVAAPSIPRRPNDVTPQWLQAVLQAEVATVDVAPIGTGQTGATYRLTVGYVAEQPELPSTFAIKLSSQDDGVRERVALGYRSEHAFYTGVADAVRVPVPEHYHCEISSDGGDFVLLLADMAPRRRVTRSAAARRTRRPSAYVRWPACTDPPGAIASGPTSPVS